METDKLSPEKTLELIADVITQARNKFEENGFIYMFWGALIALTSFSQFALLANGSYDNHWYPYLLMPIGGIYSYVYYSRKKGKRKHNVIGKTISSLWIVLLINTMIYGFVFANNLRSNLIPIILTLVSIGTIVSGTSIKSKLILISGIFVGLSAYVSFFLEWFYQPLLMGIVSVIAFFIPGVLLMIQKREK